MSGDALEREVLARLCGRDGHCPVLMARFGQDGVPLEVRLPLIDSTGGLKYVEGSDWFPADHVEFTIGRILREVLAEARVKVAAGTPCACDAWCFGCLEWLDSAVGSDSP